MRNPGLAAVLSVIIPGVGQIYNGQFLWAIFWFIITPGAWIGTAGCWVGYVTSSRRISLTPTHKTIPIDSAVSS